MSKGRHEVRMPALSGMAGDCFRPFLFHSGVFCLFLAVAQRLSNQRPYNISVILHRNNKNKVIMNNRRTAPGGQMTHMLSAILAKVTNIEKLLAPAIHNLPDSEILDSKGVRLLTKMSDRTLLRRRNDGSLPFHRDKGKIYYRRSDVLRAMLLEKEEHSKNKRL